MGRSILQGMPWHYEYASGRKSHSKNCAYNTGEHCSCKPCAYYHKACVGRSDCEWFEHASGSLTQRSKDTNVKKSVPAAKKKQKKVVVPGHTVLVQQTKTKELIEIKVTDLKNPFVGKTYNDIVKIKGEDYRVLSFSFR